MSLQQFFLILRSRWRLALPIFFGVVALAIAVSLVLPDQYTATASVVADISKPDPLAPTANSTDQATTAYMATQVSIINSDRVVKEVANTFQFDPAFNFHQKWEKSTQGKTDLIVC